MVRKILMLLAFLGCSLGVSLAQAPSAIAQPTDDSRAVSVTASRCTGPTGL